MGATSRYMACFLVICLGLLCLSGFGSANNENAAADAVAAAFAKARQAARLPKLERMGRNRFRKQVCKHDLRFPSGLVDDVIYRTTDPRQLPDAVGRLTKWSDGDRRVARFGVGVCLEKTNPKGQSTYSVVIAIYESRWTSFWRIFLE